MVPIEVDEFAQAVLVERRAGVVLRQDAFERGLSRSMATMASSTSLPIVGCLALAWRCDQRASLGTQKTFSARYSSGSSGLAPCVVALAGHELGVVFLERVGDVFEEDEAEDDVLVFRRVHVVAQLVGREPELGLEAQRRAVAVVLSLRLGHPPPCSTAVHNEAAQASSPDGDCKLEGLCHNRRLQFGISGDTGSSCSRYLVRVRQAAHVIRFSMA